MASCIKGHRFLHVHALNLKNAWKYTAIQLYALRQNRWHQTTLHSIILKHSKAGLVEAYFNTDGILGKLERRTNTLFIIMVQMRVQMRVQILLKSGWIWVLKHPCILSPQYGLENSTCTVLTWLLNWGEPEQAHTSGSFVHQSSLQRTTKILKKITYSLSFLPL